MNARTKNWLAIALVLIGAAFFAIGVYEIPGTSAVQSLKNPSFDQLVGLVFMAVALAVSWWPAKA